MLVPDALGVKVLLIILLEDILEDILESAVVLLENGVLGAHVERETLDEGQLEAGVGEAADGVISVELCLGNTGTLKVVDLDALGLTARGGVDELKGTRAGDQTVGGTVLVAKGVSADDDGLLPARDETGDAVDDNGLTEHGSTAEDVSWVL